MTGVSAMTISRVLNDKGPKGSFSEATRQRVLAAARSAKYHLNYIGRRLQHNRSGLIGVITHEGMLGSWYFERVFQALQKTLLKADYHIALYDCLSENFNNGEKCARLCHEKRADGLVVVAPNKDDFFIETFSDFDIPLIVLGCSPGEPAISFVDVDNCGGANAATSHLIGLGHRKISFVRGLPFLRDAKERESAFRKTMADHDLPVNENWVIQGDYETRRTFHAMRDILISADRPTAVFAANDLSAIGVIDAAHFAGLKVPGDLSVIGFDDAKDSEVMTPPLSTVRQPVSLLGSTAAEHLLRLIFSGESPSRRVLRKKFPFELVVRSSTAPPS
jgi:LacI family transcriptional regulator